MMDEVARIHMQEIVFQILTDPNGEVDMPEYD